MNITTYLTKNQIYHIYTINNKNNKTINNIYSLNNKKANDTFL